MGYTSPLRCSSLRGATFASIVTVFLALSTTTPDFFSSAGVCPTKVRRATQPRVIARRFIVVSFQIALLRSDAYQHSFLVDPRTIEVTCGDDEFTADHGDPTVDHARRAGLFCDRECPLRVTCLQVNGVNRATQIRYVHHSASHGGRREERHFRIVKPRSFTVTEFVRSHLA